MSQNNTFFSLVGIFVVFTTIVSINCVKPAEAQIVTPTPYQLCLQSLVSQSWIRDMQNKNKWHTFAGKEHIRLMTICAEKHSSLDMKKDPAYQKLLRSREEVLPAAMPSEDPSESETSVAI